MFDFSHLPQNAVLNEYVFQSPWIGSVGNLKPRTWHKPPNARLVFMLAIGGGGGGAGGQFYTGSSNVNGGGGGGSGAISQTLWSASFMPNTLYILPHNDGLSTTATGVGGNINSSGEAGSSVMVASYPPLGTTAPSSLFQLYISASGGTGGTTTASGAGGANTLASFRASCILQGGSTGRVGTWVVAGLAGNTSVGTGLPILGGGGGGGILFSPLTEYNGAGFTSDFPLIFQSIGGGLASSGLAASNGVRLPFLSVGGSGGGANAVGTGGRGGNGGGYGAGGGGGGAGVTPGRGGNGGPAYVCIIAW